MKSCPTCGQPLMGEVYEVIGRTFLSPHQRRIALRLAQQFGHWVEREALFAAVWADSRDGGPLNAGNVISVHVHHLRRRLAEVGLMVEGVSGRGGARRLVWAKTQEVAA